MGCSQSKFRLPFVCPWILVLFYAWDMFASFPPYIKGLEGDLIPKQRVFEKQVLQEWANV